MERAREMVPAEDTRWAEGLNLTLASIDKLLERRGAQLTGEVGDQGDLGDLVIDLRRPLFEFVEHRVHEWRMEGVRDREWLSANPAALELFQ